MFSHGSSRPQRKERETKPQRPSLCPLNNVTTITKNAEFRASNRSPQMPTHCKASPKKAINDCNQITREAQSPHTSPMRGKDCACWELLFLKGTMKASAPRPHHPPRSHVTLMLMRRGRSLAAQLGISRLLLSESLSRV